MTRPWGAGARVLACVVALWAFGITACDGSGDSESGAEHQDVTGDFDDATVGLPDAGSSVGQDGVAVKEVSDEPDLITEEDSGAETCVPGDPGPDDDCDGVDDDCDGDVDEDFVSEDTACGVGACAATGVTSCVDGVMMDSCEARAPAADDVTCDGVDDDCDGAVDEDFVSETVACGDGACQAEGTTTCVDGEVGSSCSPGGAAGDDASCNGIDDDCDGDIDEDFVSEETSCGVGACAATGVTSCVGGAVLDSCEAPAPAADDATCDGVDDDCDGTADEDFVGGATSCGVGACAATGETSCVAGEVRDSCAAGAPASDDATCDGVDDDCDGTADEDGDCGGDIPSPVVDTNQHSCYGDTACMACADGGDDFFGQDAQYDNAQPRYQDNGDGTVTDLVTGLMWQQDPGSKMTLAEAMAGVDSFDLAGYDDWRLPTIKEQYSLIQFSGVDPSGYEGDDTSGLVQFIDTDYFYTQFGDTSAGERIIDGQFATTSLYVGDGFEGETMFGVNFVDGRIKGYGTGPMPGQSTDKQFFVMHVRGAAGYGENDFVANGDGTVSDRATGLVWQRADSGEGMVWVDALGHCEALELAGSDDWRLPNVKELQSIVDYTRSPDTSASAAIDPVFQATSITNERGETDWAFYWSSTTHASWMAGHGGAAAAYVAFGRGLGYMDNAWVDIHGAGCQRSDPKDGDPSDYPTGNGPQGDAIRIYNYVRCVRDGATAATSTATCEAPTEPVCGDGVCDSGEADTCPDDCQTTEPVCGDGVCDTGEQMTCPDDCGTTTGPVACDSQSDCDAPGACPTEAALGCTCAETPDGSLCVPQCDTEDDCPAPPGQTMTCSPDGTCVPAGGPPR